MLISYIMRQFLIKNFANEMIRSYNINLTNKLDNDNLIECNK